MFQEGKIHCNVGELFLIRQPENGLGPPVTVTPPFLCIPGDTVAGATGHWMKSHGLCVKGIYHKDLIQKPLRKPYD